MFNRDVELTEKLCRLAPAQQRYGENIGETQLTFSSSNLRSHPLRRRLQETESMQIGPEPPQLPAGLGNAAIRC
jgi:hypothetical protein